MRTHRPVEVTRGRGAAALEVVGNGEGLKGREKISEGGCEAGEGVWSGLSRGECEGRARV